ncbi:MAG: hypothetical protein WCK54_12235 [Desulfuromonadales bacterium]
MKRISRTLVVVLMLLFAGAGAVQGDHYGGGHRGGYYRGWDWLPFWFGVTAIATLPYYLAPRNPPQTVIIQQPAPPEEGYVQPPPPLVQSTVQYYWYYCQNPMGYYPYVKECPSVWMKVVPNVPQSILPHSPEPPDLRK